MQLPHVSAAQVIGATPMTSNAVENLVSRLKNPEWYVRHNAGAELLQIEIPDLKLTDPLIELLAISADDDVRLNSAYVLGQSKEPKALEPLLKALNDKSERVQEFVLTALWNFQDSKMVEPLLKFLLKTDEPHLADYVVNALLPIADERVVEPIIDCLKNRPESNAAIYGPKLLAKLRDLRAVEPLINHLKTPTRSSVHIIEALGEFSDKRATDVLINSLKFRDLSGIRWKSAEALGKIGDKKAVEPLIEALDDYDVSVNSAAARSLEILGDERGREPLKKYYTQRDEQRAETAKWAYSPVPGIDPAHLNEWLRLLNSQDGWNS